MESILTRSYLPNHSLAVTQPPDSREDDHDNAACRSGETYVPGEENQDIRPKKAGSAI